MAAFIVVFAYFLAPQAPLRIRYFAILAILCSPLIFKAARDRWVQVFTGYTAFLVLIGLYYSAVVEDGVIEDSFYPIKNWLVVVLLVATAKNFRPSAYVVFAVAWLSIQSIVVCIEFASGPIWKSLQIPILSEEQVTMKLLSVGASERFGALTFESSVLGAMGALWSIFLLVTALLFAELSGIHGRSFFGRLCLIMSFLGVGLTLAARSKSGLLILGVVLVTLLLILLFARHAGRLRLVALLAVAGVGVLGSAGFYAFKSTSFGYYFGEEYERVYRFFSWGSDRNAESGLDTRYSYARIAIGGLIYHPLGVGFSSGFSYADPMLQHVYISKEMKSFFEVGVYRGYKSTIANELMTGGIVAIAVLLLSASYLLKSSRLLHGFWPQYSAVVLFIAVLVTGVSAELWPMWPMITFFYAWFTSLDENGWVPQQRWMLPRRASFRQLR